MERQSNSGYINTSNSDMTKTPHTKSGLCDTEPYLTL